MVALLPGEIYRKKRGGPALLRESPILGGQAGQCLEVTVRRQERKAQPLRQGSQHHVYLGKDSPAAAEVVVDLAVDLSRCEIQRPDVDRGEKAGQGFPIDLWLTNLSDPHFQLTKRRNTGPDSYPISLA